MNIHEYQAKNLFKEFGIKTPSGFLIQSKSDIENIKNIDGDIFAVKSQILAGGRGAGKFFNTNLSGVVICNSIEEVKENARNMLHNTLVTKQTGKSGIVVDTLYIEQGVNIADEFYISFLVDRNDSCIKIIASSEGGSNIEDIAKATPEKINYINIDYKLGITDNIINSVLSTINLNNEYFDEIKQFLHNVYELFNKKDCELIEVNPLVLTKNNEIIALDGKISFDNNALYRQPEIENMRPESDIDEIEERAKASNLNFIKLDGDIACMVNGAGLAMATNDTIAQHGLKPANFLDVGGTANKETVKEAINIILLDKNVKIILINIFGGIVKCDIIANGILQAASEIDLDIDIVIRLEGTNIEQGMNVLKQSKIKNISYSNSLKEAMEIIKSKLGNNNVDFS